MIVYIHIYPYQVRACVCMKESDREKRGGGGGEWGSVPGFVFEEGNIAVCQRRASPHMLSIRRKDPFNFFLYGRARKIHLNLFVGEGQPTNDVN
jgi:hypothetical protein